MYNSEHNEVQKYQISPEMQSTIALVDDDRNILTSVSIALEAEGFVVQKYDKTRQSSECNGVDIGYFIVAKTALPYGIKQNISFEEIILQLIKKINE